MKRPSAALLHTTAFRVAAAYAVVYALITGAAVASVYAIAEHQIHVQVQAGIIDETTVLVSLLRERGPEGLREIIAERSAHEAPLGEIDPRNPDARYYVLEGGRGEVLVGDLRSWPQEAPKNGWIQFDDDRFGRALGLVTPLADGTRLLVAQSLARPDALSATIRRWVIVAAVLALAAGLLGGLAVGSRVMRQIRGAVGTAERIQAGRLTERLPITGSSEQAILARAFNAMLDRIETALLGLRDLAARTAHEMQHPLTRTDHALVRAQSLEEVGAIRVELAAAREEIADVSRRVNALLRLARIEAGAQREYFGELDLARLSRDVADLYAPLAEDRRGRIEFRGPAGLPYVGDRQLLAQALANLVDNAIKYSPERSTIVIRLASGGAAHVLEVYDTGGKRQEPAPSGPARRAPGAGFGLPITRAIARLHDGELSIVSEDGGFRARLTLPAAAPQGNAGPAGAPSANGA